METNTRQAGLYKMKTITKYIADDKREFTNEADCVDHEWNCVHVESIMMGLPPSIDDTKFSNGSGYIQHDRESLLEVRNKFLEFVKRYTKHEWIQQSIDKGFDAHPSWVGRILSESAPSSIAKHWYRFSCIDKDLREWGQPYYADHPNDAKQVRLNS